MELFESGACDLAIKIKTGTISSEEVTKAVLQKIEQREYDINAYITTTPELALKRAKSIDIQRIQGKDIGLLGGIPMAIKDSIITAGIRTTAGSHILENFIPPYNAHVIDKLLDAGAVIVGKTNTDEFTMGSTCETSYFKPARNPHNTGRVTGGSSGGSAAALAAHECIAALGSDTGGSIRQPASFCGITGIKPTYGRVSRYGLIAYASSLDQIGPMTKSVKDSALVLSVIAGYDNRDSTCLNEPVPDYLTEIDSGISGIKIGLPKEYFEEGLDSEVCDITMKAVEIMKSEGAEFIDISLPHTEYAIPTYYLLATAEASANLERYDGVRYGYRAENPENLYDMYCKSRSEGFGIEVKRRIMLGTYCLSAGYYDAYYRKAQKVRRLIKEDFDKAFKTVDAILTPVSPTPAFPLGSKINDPLQMYLADIYTISLNLAGLPGISVPAGKTSDNLPVGVQFMGRVLDENLLFRLAYALERNVGTSLTYEGAVV
ncbi:MAG: Asp-tRNA(Asn)/Glu-tRNA(Gln) amidotransferase subunit GatA [Candidatus Latescibacteria bacterium]|nr:Asp-tRNA(Asn)/Glu-tRNA(Gln) amidotransferase subunit GatA [Candidatus Latescibacterota bacterium]